MQWPALLHFFETHRGCKGHDQEPHPRVQEGQKPVEKVGGEVGGIRGRIVEKCLAAYEDHERDGIFEVDTWLNKFLTTSQASMLAYVCNGLSSGITTKRIVTI